MPRENVPSRGPEPRVQSIRETEEQGELVHASTRIGHAVEAAEEVEICAQRHAVIDRRLVGHETAATPNGRGIGPDRDPVNDDVSVARREDPRDDAARGRLSGTVGSEQRDDLTWLHVEGDLIECGKRTESPRDGTRIDHRLSIRACLG